MNYFDIFFEHIKQGKDPIIWLPILVVGYLAIEWKSLMQFWIGQEGRPPQELTQLQYSQLLLGAYRRRTISGLLLGLISGAFIMSLLLFYS